jgi:hypothetical protein
MRIVSVMVSLRNQMAPERVALRHSPKSATRPALTWMYAESAEAENSCVGSVGEAAGEPEPDHRRERLLAVRIDRSHDTVDLVRADGCQRQLAA